MATRTEETVINKKLRSVAKTQITRIYNLVVQEKKIENISSDEADARLESLKQYWSKFVEAQSKIEIACSNEEEEQNEAVREEVENKYIEVAAKLKQKVKIGENTTILRENNKDSTKFTSNVISSFVFTPFQEEESFGSFIKRFNNYMVIKNIHDNELRLCLFLNAIPPLLHEKLQDILNPKEPNELGYEAVVKILKEYLEPSLSILGLQHKFVSRLQNNETSTEFAIELQKLAKDCQFHCVCGKSVADMLLRMQFVRGLANSEVRCLLLQNKGINTFKEAVDLATAVEASKLENEMIQKNYASDVHSLDISQRKTNIAKSKVQPLSLQKQLKGKEQAHYERQAFMSTASNFQELRGRCYRCGDSSHRANVCRFKNETCNYCKKDGHLSRVCMNRTRSRKIHHIVENDGNFDELDHAALDVNKIDTQLSTCDKFMMNLKIEERPIKMELDTGAALSSISYKDYLNLKIDKKIFHTNVQLRTYTGELIKPKGVVYVRFQYKNSTYFGKLFIIDAFVEPIFGRDWIREINLQIGEIKLLEEQSSNLDKVLNEFSEVFTEDVGCIPSELGHLKLLEGQQPIFIKPRPVPFAIKTKLEEELKRLEEAKIITKVSNSEWGTPIVPIVKPNGSIRICADYKTTINKAVQDEKYPIPRIEEIFTEMNGGKYFCTLDIRNAYLHMLMDEESAYLQTISTHKGLYKVNRMMFGIKVAPAIWQRFMDKILQGINGVKCFFDDIIIQGSTYIEALNRLKTVLRIMKQNNLKLNLEKCKFFQNKVEYLGHTIDEHGLHKTADKVKAILEAKRPHNVNQLRSFLGMANYYNKFIPGLAEKLYPLNRLLQKGQPFTWTKDCDHSFSIVKEYVASENTLVHYNPNLTLVISTDASPFGLGAVISHRLNDGTEKPIAFASRSLSKSEKNYSQIDKEATSIYWGVRKFFPYLYGRKFILITDHKPLVSIFNPSKSLPNISATRLLNYALFLSGFDYKIEYRRTSEHCNADFLSRFPLDNTVSEQDIYSFYQLNQIASLPLTKYTLAEETRKDPFLIDLLTALKSGDSVEDKGFLNNELTLQDGCIFRGDRVFIPNSLKQTLLKELHYGHLGMTKMKAMARSYIYWKDMDRDIENMVGDCKMCALKRNEPKKLEIHPWEEPTAPWQRVHIDFFEPKQGDHFFIVVDALTKWFEIIPTKNTTSEWCIKQLRHLFSTFGLPLTIVSDNGRQFVSAVFEKYLEENSICHRTIAPYHPSSNGQAERFVQTVKKALTSMTEERGDIHYKIDRLLTQLRKAPNSTGLSSYQLMFGRDIRTNLNVLSEKSVSRTYSRNAKRTFFIGQRVQVRAYNNKEKWRLGTVVAQKGGVMYDVKMDFGPTWCRHSDQILGLKN